MEKEQLLDFFQSLSLTHQKEWARWIADAKKAETREKRLGQVADKMRDGKKSQHVSE